MFCTSSGDLMLKFTGLGYFGTMSHCTPVLVSQFTPNDRNLNLVQKIGKMGSPGSSFHIHSLLSSFLFYYYLNDISSTKQLSTVEITKEGEKITIKVKKVTFSHQIYSCKDSFLTRSRKKEGFSDIYLIRS